MTTTISPEQSRYCYLDIDVNDHRRRLATTAAFVASTNIRYGLQSSNLLELGGSELSRLQSLALNDHEWTTKFQQLGSSSGNDNDNNNESSIVTSPPTTGCRVVVKLDWEDCPLACENFATLCSNGSSTSNNSNSNKPRPIPIGDSGKPLTYLNSKFHRCIPGFCLQGGDFVKGNGSGGECVFANKTKFKDEKLGLQKKHTTQFGLLSMGNSGKNSNSSQFFFTLNNDDDPNSKKSLSSCDGKHVIFGSLVSGGQILRSIEQYGSKDGTVSTSIFITDCGLYQPLSSTTPGQGFWYDQPDPESYTGISPTFMTKPRLGFVVPHSTALTKFETNVKSFGVVELTICIDEYDKDTSPIDVITDALFTKFSVDVVIVAPVCQNIINDDNENRQALWNGWNKVPSSQKQELGLSDDMADTTDNQQAAIVSQFVIVAKPTEIADVIRTKSWLRKIL